MDLQRLQILTEVVREYKTALHMDQNKSEVGREVLDIVMNSQDLVLYGHVKRAKDIDKFPGEAIKHLDQATSYLHEKIDEQLKHS
ncbi:hypothetical protein GLW07_15120 [Bacillus hwajinpoensis]|uniref:Uncharacterized protein n=1 Tax=Guptibacillus hwajinpoensis TaxID=208199 RepID=A0A845F1P8_9BACL|nr:hypothetical protein [Pseudalkalibacillus hwajinpoensis]MYL64688.1 hypothetical protein [Pseudalkalibacillus hwajinpoensis]